ncbi:ROK family transcriptional regulator [Beutenbergia cavernae]|uniref:ROK family transcriptional regulator n=1 Tax=Beutenbergia cavernae TaxID=84757 RepID=UPI00117EDC78|nr:ROK family protein [Beutenbergia cavernae]
MSETDRPTGATWQGGPPGSGTDAVGHARGPWPVAMPATSYGALVSFIRSRPGLTRHQLLAATGMSRTTLFERLEALFQHGYVYQDGSAPPGSGTRGPGRRSELLRWDTRGRVVLVLDLGQTHARLCVTGVDGRILRMRDVAVEIDTDAPAYLAELFRISHELVEAGEDETLIGVALGIPGPVDPATGILGTSTTMPRWERFPVLDSIRDHWQVPAVIENDARAFALGESSVIGADRTVLAVKYATGIGAGIVDAGHVLEGADGAAGDIGHVRITDDGPVCTCGRRGCLAAWASGHALLRRLADTGVRNLRDIVERVAAGDPAVCAAVDDATARLSRVLATVVAAANPDDLVLGGALGRIPRVVSRIDASIRQDVTERARHHLTVSAAHLGADGAVVGLSRKVVDLVYDPAVIDAAILGQTGAGTATPA